MNKQQRIVELKNLIAQIEPELDIMKKDLILKKSIHGIDDSTTKFKSREAVQIHNLSQMVDELQVTLDHYKAEINIALGASNN